MTDAEIKTKIFRLILRFISKAHTFLRNYYIFCITILFTITIISGLSNRAFAQKIQNVRAEQQGKKINIYYNITEAKTQQTFDVKVYCSKDGGSTWGNPLYYVTGDVGKGVSGGYNKKIVWDVLKEVERLRGDDIKFQVRAKITGGGNTITDSRDGQTYKTVKLGTQVWLAENLNYKTGACWCYDNKLSNCDIYGRLYTWETAKNACPSGWHLPTDNEWKTLEKKLGMSSKDADDTGWRGTKEGGKLKEAGTSHWKSPNKGATNSSGFTALPGGYRNSRGSFVNLGNYATFWSATGGGSSYAWYRTLHYDDVDVGRDDDDKSYGFSVRCVKDY